MMECATATGCGNAKQFGFSSCCEAVRQPRFLSPSYLGVIGNWSRGDIAPCSGTIRAGTKLSPAKTFRGTTTRSFAEKGSLKREKKVRMLSVKATPSDSRNGSVSVEAEETAQKRSDAVKLEDDSSSSTGSRKGGEMAESAGAGGIREGGESAESAGVEKTQKSAAQKAALSALDAQLNKLSDDNVGQLSARRKFAEDIARKTGRPVPSESAPSKRTVAGDYLDKGAWDLTKPPTIDFELDASFFAYTGVALLTLTVITNLFLNKFFPVPTREEIRAMRIRDEPGKEFEDLEERGTGLNLRAPTLIDR